MKKWWIIVVGGFLGIIIGFLAWYFISIPTSQIIDFNFINNFFIIFLYPVVILTAFIKNVYFSFFILFLYFFLIGILVTYLIMKLISSKSRWKWVIFISVVIILVIISIIIGIIKNINNSPTSPDDPFNPDNTKPHNCFGVYIDVVKYEQENNTYWLKRGVSGDELYNTSIIIIVDGNIVPESDYIISNGRSLEQQLNNAKITFKYPIEGKIEVILWPDGGCPKMMRQ